MGSRVGIRISGGATSDSEAFVTRDSSPDDIVHHVGGQDGDCGIPFFVLPTNASSVFPTMQLPPVAHAVAKADWIRGWLRSHVMSVCLVDDQLRCDTIPIVGINNNEFRN